MARVLVPGGGHREKGITMAVGFATTSSKNAEAEVGKALGHEICKCEVSPTALLTGEQLDGRPKPARLRMPEVGIQYGGTVHVQSHCSRKSIAASFYGALTSHRLDDAKPSRRASALGTSERKREVWAPCGRVIPLP